MRERDFLDAVLDRPLDNTPRLVYADWLDERADTLTCSVCSGLGKYIPRKAEVREPIRCYTCSGIGIVPDRPGCLAKLIRVQVAAESKGGLGIHDRRQGFLEAFIDGGPPYPDEVLYFAEMNQDGPVSFAVKDDPGSESITFARGFPSRVSLPLAALTDDVAKRLGRVPGLLEVRLSDREPYRYLDAVAWGWSVSRGSRERGESSWVPDPIWTLAMAACRPDEGNVYHVHDDAVLALSHAALDHCRILAGLLPVWHPLTTSRAS